MGTKIAWTDETWNPVTGCTKISPGCAHCYAARMADRLKAMGCARYANGFEVTVHEDVIDRPRNWKKPRMVFVNSMSDLFHEDVPFETIRKVFRVMNDLPMHTFQVLSKREQRLAELAPQLKWTDNIWMGVTVEDNAHAYRADVLRDIPAAVRFVSAEPLLGPLPDLSISVLDWLIVGGESGPGCRPMDAQWAEDLMHRAREADVPFFFKQWGGVHARKAPLIQGSIVQEWPLAKRSDAVHSRLGG